MDLHSVKIVHPVNVRCLPATFTPVAGSLQLRDRRAVGRSLARHRVQGPIVTGMWPSESIYLR